MNQRAFTAFVIVATLMSADALAQQKMDDMKGTPSMNGMGDMKNMNMGKSPAPAAKTHKAEGVVQAVDVKAGTVTVAHGPVPTLHWDAMTMDFKVKDRNLLKKFVKGGKVAFEFVEESDDYVVTAVK